MKGRPASFRNIAFDTGVIAERMRIAKALAVELETVKRLPFTENNPALVIGQVTGLEQAIKIVKKEAQ